MDVYLVGFHPMKDHPGHQMEAHHFCHQVNQDFTRCTLFDGNGRNANLTGIEYIVSEKPFETLPADERCDSPLAQRVLGEVHMLQHQAAAPSPAASR